MHDDRTQGESEDSRFLCARGMSKHRQQRHSRPFDKWEELAEEKV